MRTTVPRGYGQALTFYALTFGVSAATAILYGAAAWGFHPGWTHAVDQWASLAYWTTLGALTVWLAATRRCHLIWAWTAAILVLIAAFAAVTGGAMPTPDGVYELLLAVAATPLALTLADRHGLSWAGFGIGRRWLSHEDHSGRRQAFTVYWWALTGVLASSFFGMAIIAAGLPHGQHPIHNHENPLSVALRICSAGITEEVLTVTVVIALSAARRPTREIYTLPVLMRVSYHMYYQAVGPAVLAMGLMNVWLYRRTRRLTPLICAHIIIDALSYTRQFGAIPAATAATICYLTCLLLTKFWRDAPAKTEETGPMT